MNREILFRGKDVVTGAWREGSLVMVTDGETLRRYPNIAISYNHDTFDWHDVLPKTVGQFTGLTDKNGKKIFEGDIVLIPEGQGWNGFYYKIPKRKAIVKWKETKFDLIPKTRGEIKQCFLWSELEVIGNIHDNPKLLNRSK
jgi:uncharacterized phage protein (TIGR01671 family)